MRKGEFEIIATGSVNVCIGKMATKKVVRFKFFKIHQNELSQNATLY
jgi:hypothetical protein